MPNKTFIKISRDAAGGRATVPVGVNGYVFTIPTGEPYEAQEGVLDVLRGSGIPFEEVDAPEGAASEEGSVDVAPAGTPPAMLPQSQEAEYGDPAVPGDQPGNVTPGVEAPAAAGEVDLEAAAAISDTRVAAERQTAGDTAPAELAGEGEGGTKKVSPQSGGSRRKR